MALSLADILGPAQMYKSVAIRDSRQSLQLGTSMWRLVLRDQSLVHSLATTNPYHRLSWITFIFLPLTFITGVFGMNVDIFKENPRVKWYFITAVPFVSPSSPLPAPQSTHSPPLDDLRNPLLVHPQAPTRAAPADSATTRHLRSLLHRSPQPAPRPLDTSGTA